jgi:phosphoglycolate phosphatase
MSNYQCVLFDLDGTLAHTAGDLLLALNKLLREEDRPPLPMSAVRDYVSHGSNKLLKLAFGPDQPEADFARRRTRFLDLYQNNICEYTRLFPGTSALLRSIERSGGCWGIVTNKPAFLTDPLIYELELEERAACVISGDTTSQSKPHPLPMLTAAEQAGVAPEACIYVGDAQRDIEAGNAAGMLSLIAGWGYIDQEQTPETWGAAGTVMHMQEIMDWYQTPPS